jgi:predicted acyltransferase
MRLSRAEIPLRSLDVFRGITIASMILVNKYPGFARRTSIRHFANAKWFDGRFRHDLSFVPLDHRGVALNVCRNQCQTREGSKTIVPLPWHATRKPVGLLFLCGVALIL